MKRAMLKTVGFGIVLGFLCSSAGAAVLYTVTDLGQGAANSINNNGQIVGWARNSAGYQSATFFDATGNGNNKNLGTVGERDSCALSINNNGQIVGWAFDINNWDQATLFDATGQGNNKNLGTGTISGLTRGAAYSINNNGQIVGYVHDPYSNRDAATLFDATGNGNNKNLGTYRSEDYQYYSLACSINDNGQIVGVDPPNSRATIFDPTGNYHNNTSLGVIPGSPSWSDTNCALSINNNGQIVGQGYDFYGLQAVLFDPTGHGNNIALTHDGGIAYSINNNGQIVGYEGNSGATLFDSTGNGNNLHLNTVIDPSSGWNLQYAHSINDNGWIVGWEVNPQGQTDAFLLKPVPEPATLSLFALGILGFLRRRKS